jgi:hypothetical protein
MKGDFTRVTFDPARHFSRVLMQQGRVQLDADFNEQSAILLHFLRTLTADLIGPYGGPADLAGFGLTTLSASEIKVETGHYYVDGILVENHDSGFSIRLPDSDGNYFAYLDVWERHITHLQDPYIREVALGGPDTCTRAKVTWQVRLHEHEGWTTCDDAIPWLDKLSAGQAPQNRPRMKAWVRDEGKGTDACSIPPESRYRGMENQLYRIEVHRGGPAWDGESDKGVPSGNAGEAATFKWSRDNGSVVFPIVKQQGSVVFVEHLGRDRRTGLAVGDWVEIMDDSRELAGVETTTNDCGLELAAQPGILAQVESIDTVEVSVTLAAPEGGSAEWPEYDEESRTHPLLRRWDHRKIAGQAMEGGGILLAEGDALEIEDGIDVEFAPGIICYRTGDYWLIPARVATGSIQWPEDEDGNALAEPPAGIRHHYAPLALIDSGDLAEDCRCGFDRLPCEPMRAASRAGGQPRTSRDEAEKAKTERTNKAGSTKKANAAGRAKGG